MTASRFRLPTVRRTVMSESARGTSYESICAVARRPPRNEYLDPDAQPPSTTPYVAKPAQASATSTPEEVLETMTGKFSGKLHSPNTEEPAESSPPHGMMAKPQRAGVRIATGASRKRI